MSEEENESQASTFGGELGFPADEGWMKEITDIFAEFARKHQECLGRLAQSFLLSEGCKDVEFTKLYKAIGENELHAPLLELLVFFMHTGFLKGMQLGEARTVDNAERDASLKRLLRGIGDEPKGEGSSDNS